MAIGKILVPLAETFDSTDALDLAVAAGRLLYAHVEALYAQPDPVDALRYATGFEPIGLVNIETAQFEREANSMREQAHHRFVDWADRAHVALDLPETTRTWDVTARWREYVGSPERAIGDLGRFSDLIVLRQPDPEGAGPGLRCIEAALFDADRPVLLTPPHPKPLIGRNAVVAWNGSREALHALSEGLPLLTRMHRIVVLTVGEADAPKSLEEELTDYLSCHGIKAERRIVTPNRLLPGERLLREAAESDADLLVMGAYTHSRVREAVLGGTTRHVIQHATLPVLLTH